MKWAGQSLEAYEAAVLNEVRGEASSERQTLSSFRLVEFESRSTGRNRPKRRHAREVTLFVDRTASGTRAYSVVRGEIRPQRRGRGTPPDILANEALSFLPPNERTTDRLLQEVREMKLKLRR